jgi:hypothetical protein
MIRGIMHGIIHGLPTVPLFLACCFFQIKTESGNVTSGTAMLPSLPLRANPVPSLSVNPSSKEVFPQRPARRQAVQQQQFSELSSFDAWQLPASSLASKLPQPARSREASGHLVSGGSPLSPAAGAIDYSIEVRVVAVDVG